jgi:hypothetical protein
MSRPRIAAYLRSGEEEQLHESTNAYDGFIRFEELRRFKAQLTCDAEEDGTVGRRPF